MVKIRTLNINSVSFITYLEKMVRYEQMKCKRFVLFFFLQELLPETHDADLHN